jgi:formylmethanofuran dehydrogenase subunit E
MNIQPLLEKSSRDHSHLCPRQILGVRMGLCGMKALGFDAPPDKTHLLIITETDGCFADGLSAATNCTVGHRTLRVEDYGKAAATFVDTRTGLAVRVVLLWIFVNGISHMPRMNPAIILLKCRRTRSCPMKRCSQ